MKSFLCLTFVTFFSMSNAFASGALAKCNFDLGFAASSSSLSIKKVSYYASGPNGSPGHSREFNTDEELTELAINGVDIESNEVKFQVTTKEYGRDEERVTWFTYTITPSSTNFGAPYNYDIKKFYLSGPISQHTFSKATILETPTAGDLIFADSARYTILSPSDIWKRATLIITLECSHSRFF